MKALLVDDENYILEYLSHAADWKELGFDQVDLSSDSTEAKELLIRNNYNLLITDIRMPEISGIDLLKIVEESNLKTKVMFLSGYSEFEYAQQAIKYGLYDYLLKPLSGTKLTLSLQQFISKYPDTTSPPVVENKISKTESEKTIAFIQKYVAEHIEDNVSLNFLAELVYLSPPYLSSLYKKETGNTLSSFITETRLIRSASLLKESRLKISDIAQLVGYKKPQYFDQIFSKKYGVTPQQFRRESLEK